MKFNYQKYFSILKKRKKVLLAISVFVILLFVAGQTFDYLQNKKKRKIIYESTGNVIMNLLTEMKKQSEINFYDIEDVYFDWPEKNNNSATNSPEFTGKGIKFAGSFEELKTKNKDINEIFSDYGFKPDKLNTNSPHYPRISGFIKDDILCIFKEILNANATKEQMEIKCAYIKESNK